MDIETGGKSAHSTVPVHVTHPIRRNDPSTKYMSFTEEQRQVRNGIAYDATMRRVYGQCMEVLDYHYAQPPNERGPVSQLRRFLEAKIVKQLKLLIETRYEHDMQYVGSEDI